MTGNRKTVFLLVGLALSMLALGFASKPLYDTFCRVTGFGGTPKTAEANDSEILDRVVTVTFDANVAQGLPGEFKPEQRQMDIKVGQSGLAYYSVKNVSNQPIVGTATYNVMPMKAAPFFVKTQCFCFTEQLIEAGQEVTMPVLFHIDAQIDDETRYDDVTDITLSYTFFMVEDSELLSAAQSREVLN